MDYKRRLHAHPYMMLRFALSTPFIYAVLIPVVFLDIILELYHRVCFPLYGIEYVKRSDYIRFDRWKLPYIPLWDKLNCLYCEYVNGFLAFAVAVAGRTELYWCGIKHKSGGGFHDQPHQKDFLPYGDKKALDEFEYSIIKKNA